MRASRGEMNDIIAVARAWVSAFSLRLLIQLRRRSSICLSVFLSTGWIKRKFLARDCSPKCTIEKTQRPRVSTEARDNVEHKAPSSPINGGAGSGIKRARLPGQGDNRLHRRVVRGPASVESSDVDAGPGDRDPRGREDPVDALVIKSRRSVVEKGSPGVRDTVYRDIPRVDERILGGDSSVGERTNTRVEVASHDGGKGAGPDERPHQRGGMDTRISGSMIEMSVQSPEFVAGDPVTKGGIDKYSRNLVAPGSGAGDARGIRERGLLPAEQCEPATVVEQGTAFATTIGVSSITDRPVVVPEGIAQVFGLVRKSLLHPENRRELRDKKPRNQWPAFAPPIRITGQQARHPPTDVETHHLQLRGGDGAEEGDIRHATSLRSSRCRGHLNASLLE